LERLGVRAAVTDDPGEITAADRVIFPGVGEASSAMAYLRERGLDALLPSLGQPVLGICLGMQLMCLSSEEGDTDCLGIFPARVRRFTSGALKVPQIGWNDIYELRSPLMTGVGDGAFVYFVHGYYVEHCAETIATADYTGPYSAALRKDNFYAVQFHPEKSGAAGRRILENFIFNI
jgi:glutamine amidotransferase